MRARAIGGCREVQKMKNLSLVNLVTSRDLARSQQPTRKTVAARGGELPFVASDDREAVKTFCLGDETYRRPAGLLKSAFAPTAEPGGRSRARFRSRWCNGIPTRGAALRLL